MRSRCTPWAVRDLVVAFRTSSRESEPGQVVGLDVYRSGNCDVVLSDQVFLLLLLPLEDDLRVSGLV